MLILNGRCSRAAVVCANQLVSLKRKAEAEILVLRQNQCAAAHFPEEICFRHFRPIGLRWAVSPRSWHCRRAVHRPARDRSSLAPCWISTVLALEIQTARRETENPTGDP